MVREYGDYGAEEQMLEDAKQKNVNSSMWDAIVMREKALNRIIRMLNYVLWTIEKKNFDMLNLNTEILNWWSDIKDIDKSNLEMEAKESLLLQTVLNKEFSSRT